VGSPFACFLLLLLLLLFPKWGLSRGFPLRGVVVLLCTAAAEIHPAQVVPVYYPVVGAQSVGSAVRRGVSTNRTWEDDEEEVDEEE